jgi:hypothetical protein
MQAVGFRCPVGFKNYPVELRVGTGTITSKGGRGATTPSTVLENTSMEESDTKRQECSGEQSSDRQVARFLSEFVVQRRTEALTTELKNLQYGLSQDRFVGEEQFRAVEQQLEETIEAVRAVAVAEERLNGGGSTE